MPRPEIRAEQTALLFPTGGAHWPGMGRELDEVDAHARAIDRAELALERAGAQPRALRRLMAGEGQAKREPAEGRWRWTGDFPLSVAAQTVVGACLGQQFLRRHGAPRCVLGESMGECAAFAVAGALGFEDAVLVAYRWAQALQAASDALGLRMVVVEGLEREPLLALAAPLDATIVVSESRTLYVLSLPVANFEPLRAALAPVGASMLVSTNACVAHDPRLATVVEPWQGYRRFVEGLAITAPRLELATALRPGERLATADQVRQSLLETTSTPVRWAETVALLPEQGVRLLLALGLPSRAYVLEKLRGEEPRLGETAIRAVRALAGV
jgi:malonyl CoA-acyl carrier protein transacylase